MKPIYRKLKQEDLPVIVQLMSQLGYRHTVSSLTDNVEYVRTKNGEIFVAELSGKVVGCISAILDARLAEGVTGELVSLVVNESARGKGIGKGLVSTAEKWLIRYTKVIRVRANETREEAHQFYQSLGYAKSKKQIVFSKSG